MVKIISAGLVGVFLAIMLFLLVYFALPSFAPDMGTVIDRLVYTLQCNVFSIAVLIIAIQVIALQRFSGDAIDPVANTMASQKLKVNIQFLENTFEQMTVFVLLSLILATYLKPSQMQVIPALVTVFCFARLLFWIGYQKEGSASDAAWKRSFGMAINLVMNLSIAIVCLLFFFHLLL